MATTSKRNEVAKSDGDDFVELAKRAQDGDKSAAQMLRKAMEKAPWLAEIGGNLATKIQDKVISEVAGTNLLFQEIVLVKMDRLRKQLSGDNPTALERLLVDRIALCWLVLHVAELRLASAKDLTWKQDECWQAHIDSSNKRYLSSIRTLATVRKLAPPGLQVNVVKRQVNARNTGGEGDNKSSGAGHLLPSAAAG